MRVHEVQGRGKHPCARGATYEEHPLPCGRHEATRRPTATAEPHLIAPLILDATRGTFSTAGCGTLHPPRTHDANDDHKP
jgi:hypothetical protein